MGNGDVSDLHQRGVSLDDMARAAEMDDPVIPRNTVALADKGLELLTALKEAVAKAQGKTDAVTAIAGMMADEVQMQAVGAAFHHKPGQVQAAIAEMRLVRGTASACAELEKEAKRQSKMVGAAVIEREGRYNTVVLDKLVSSLGVSGLRAPPGWRVSQDEGVVGPDNEVVASRPMVILGSSCDVDSGTVRLHLAWQTAAGWRHRHVPRGTALNHRKVVDLIDHEAPITSITSSAVVKYLASFEQENGFVPKRSTSHMGWIDDETFLHGSSVIGQDIFLAVDDGGASIVNACAPSGSMRAWMAAVEEYVVSRPMILLGIYASCASVLLRVLERPGFLFEWSGDSSLGKTTALVVAASCWGMPSVNGIIGKWNTASVSGPLAQAVLLQSMPLCLDETKEGKPEVISQMMYSHTSGRDRTRSKQDGGLRHAGTWLSVLLSTGEAPITSFSKDQGARARCLCLSGPPVGPDSEANGEASNRIKEAMSANYGHMGPRLVEWLIAHRGQWDKLRARYKTLVSAYAAEGNTAMSRRLLENVAVLHLCADLLHNELDLPGESEEALRMLVGFVLNAEPDADLQQLAADDLYVWAASNEAKFWRRTPKSVEPPGGWLGRWEDDNNWDRIGFQPKVVEEMLKRWGYDVESILRGWSSRGWRVLYKGQNPNYGRSKSRMLVLSRQAFSSVRTGQTDGGEVDDSHTDENIEQE